MAASRFKQYTYIPQNPLPLSPPRVTPKPNPFDMYRDEKDTVVQTIHVEEESVFPVIDDGVYQPKSKRTRAAYEILLSLIQQPFPGQPLFGQPLSTVRFIADKILEILKNDAVDYHEKKINVEILLNPIPNHVFDQLVSVGNLITDFYGFAAGHVDGGVVDGIRSLSICSRN
ncbi:unnamed protein product [Vicia faba]|uniref:Uncharacterized protein n=1 Tax=Vicia faba TaxID=3906 RepID=A0AAV0ZA09_VICFA|nr:unnamed protein product [Vicia faba]